MITGSDILMFVTAHWRILVLFIPLIIAVVVVRILR